MYRILPETGEILVPHLFDDGTYGAADPAHGSKRHHIHLRVPAATLEELREHHLQGWPIWMSIRGTRDRRLISRGIVDSAPPGEPAEPMAQEHPVAAPRQAKEMATEATPPSSAFLAPGADAGEIAKHYLSMIASMSDAEASSECTSPAKLLMAASVVRGRTLSAAYAPFDHVNQGGRIVIVGITPGLQQMELAIGKARRAMASGASGEEALARAKVHASFGGPMRKNLVKMLDALGMNEWLGIGSAASLWGAHAGLAHFTSALRYPVFIDGKNYSRSPHLLTTPFLFSMASKWLAEEIALFPDAVFVPMGDMVDETLLEVGRRHGLGADRILSGIPHAAGSNNGPIARFLGSKGEDDPWRVRFHKLKGVVEALPRASAPSP